MGLNNLIKSLSVRSWKNYDKYDSVRVKKKEMIRHPEVKVKFSGLIEPNAFLVMGLVGQALRIAKVPVPEVDQFNRGATRGDYDHLLKVVHQWVEVE